MKKLNLIEWLSRNSHEKQKPQRFARYAAILVMLLTLGVGQMWADNTHVIAVAGENPNDYKVKVESNNGGEKWMYEFTRAASITFEGKKLYVGSYNEKYGGVNGLDIHYYNSSDGWVDKCSPFTSWTTSLNDEQVYNKDNCSWYAKKTVSTGARVYFQPDEDWTSTSNKIWVGHANYQRYYTMNRVTNTQLYYGEIVTNGWTNAMGIGVVGGTTAEDGPNYFTNAATNSSEYTGLKNWDVNNISVNNVYLIVSNGDAGETPTMSYHASHYANNALNYTLTMKYAVSTNGATPAELTSDYIPATITVSTYKFSNGKYNAVDESSLAAAMTKNGSTYTSTATAARTAATTFAVSSIDDDYAFLGWYTAASGGDLLSSDETYTTYLPTASATIYARFSHENNHSVTISHYCTSTSSEIESTSQKVGEITYSAITAPVIAGYSFSGWSYGNGISVKFGDTDTSNPIHIKTLSSGDYTLTANYTEVLTTDWKLIGDNQSGSPFGDNYAYASGKAMSKKTGHSTEANAYKTINVTKLPGSYYGFKVATSGASDDYKWGFGTSAGAYITFNRDASNVQKQVYNGSQHELKFVPDALGEYEFRVNYPSNKYVYVTFPTAYTVTFSRGTVDGASGTVTAEYSSVAFSTGTKVQSGKSVTFKAPAAKTGYTFQGWYTVNNGSGSTNRVSTEQNYTTTITAAKTLYACYTINNHEITHSVSSNGTYTIKVGSAAAVSSNTTSDYNQTITLAATPATGYHFTGWTVTKKGGGSVTVTSNQFSMPDDDVTVSATFAPNNYTITLKKHNGGSDGSVSVTFDANTGLTSDVAVPTKTGYTFAGYWTEEGGTGTKLADGDGKWQKGNAYISAGGNWVNAGNVTLHAAWTPNKYKIFIENYDPISQGTLMDDCSWPDDEDKPYLVVTFGTSVLDCYVDAVPTKLPYEFGGWYSGEAGSGDQIFGNTGFLVGGATVYTDASGNWKQASDVTLYAKWIQSSASSNIYIDRHSGTGGAITAVYNAAALASFIASTRTGYIFQGYFTAAEGGNKIINADGTLVANVGSYTDADHKWIYAGSTPTIHAQWSPITYTIAFAKNNDASYYGSETGDNPTSIAATYDVNATMPENTYSRTGYHFIGWSTEAHKAKGSCPGVDYDYAAGGTARNLTSTQGATVTLYPKWLGNTHTISFNARGGYVSQTSSNITFDETYGSGTGLSGNLPIPTPPSGYEFSGWYTASEGGTEVTKDDKMHTDGDHTLYAHYVRKDRVYFKNTLGWKNVYVTWDAEWNHGDQDKGAGASGKTQELMNHIYGTDIWYKDIPAAVLSSWKYNIAFTSESMPNYEWFSRGNAVFRRDFDKKATMFVPVPNDPNKFLKNDGGGNPGTWYYSTDQASGDPQGRYKNGYWVKYNDLQAGYDLKGSWNWVEHHYIERPNPEDSVYIFTIQGLSANTTYQFKLYKDVEVNNTGSEFSSTTSITSATAPDAAIFNAANGGSNASMKTTVAGDYTFKFNFSALGKVKLTVDYPFAVNDYKVVYSYTKDGAKTFESQYIKARANGIDTISMFIHSGDSATSRSLAIHKCTDISASGVATWNTSYASIALPTETASGKTSGVYNIRISQNESSAATGECVGRYEGQYYIRSQAADGGWDQYKVHADNLMTLSEYSLKQKLSAPYSHYFCKFIDNSTTEITFTIATDYSPSICPVMVGDATIGGLANKTLPSGNPASVRFMWNEETNATIRAYLKSAQGDGNARFLVLHGAADGMIFNNDASGTAISASGDLVKNEKIFEDTENWVYECYIKAKPGAKVSLIAKYNDLDRYLIGGPSSWETIIGGTGDSKYTMKVVYDFKTNRLMTAWVPSAGITEKLSNIDVIIERHNQDGATTITFKKATEGSEAGSIKAKSVIGALRFDYDELVGRVASWTADTRAKMMFLVSFPFDVNISDIFGLNTNYGEAFIVQQYNGAKRAEKGFFQLDGTDTFWETLPVDSVMHAGVGYCVCMDNDYLNNDVGHLWDNKKAGSSIYLYFPSANGDIVINSDPKTVHVPAHECKINRTFNGGKLNHKYTDSNWNMMGVPIFQNHTGDATTGTPGAIFTPDKDPSDTTHYRPGIGFFYKWSTDKSYSVQKAAGYEFKPMHGYLVQYAGDVTFTCATPVVASVAARRTPIEDDYELELQVLNTNEEVLNRTFVELREEACDTFALNEDLYLAMNKHDVNVYTFAGTYNVAANVLSVDNHIVPMGVVVRKEGTYTFSMPDNFSGEVILVDKSAQTRTNLAMTDYEIHLPTGTIDDRFELEININKVPTAIDGVSDGQGSLKDGKAHKFIMNDQMYILKDGVLYDARGNRVK